jgi:hypothetical protein
MSLRLYDLFSFSSLLHVQRSGFDSRRYQIFWEVVGLERGSLSLVNVTEELLERKRRGSSLKIREYGRRDPLRWPRNIFSPQKLKLTAPTSGGRSVGLVRSRTQDTELKRNFWDLSFFSKVQRDSREDVLRVLRKPCSLTHEISIFFFVISFYLQSVLLHSANCAHALTSPPL